MPTDPATHARQLFPAARCLILALLLAPWPALAQKRYDPGAGDQAIRIGNLVPYTGFYSEYGQEGKAEAAYFRMVNDRGGINGRKVEFISLDSGADPRRSVDLAHRLVEQDQVLLIFGVTGTPANLAIRPYLNERQVPQLFCASSSAALDDPAHYPWTMGLFATYRSEGRAYGRYLVTARPGARVTVLAADEDSGREYVAGLHDGLGAKASAMIVKELAYPLADPRIDSRVAELKAAGGDVFFNFSVGKLATEAIHQAYDQDWHPLQFIPNASLSTSAFLDPAGLAKATGIITNARSKGWLRPGAARDPDVAAFLAWMKQYNPTASLRDQINVAGYERAEALVAVLQRCGDDLTRANVLKQATSLDLELGMLVPGIRVHTGPDDYQPIKQLYLIRFDGKDWAGMGQLAGP